jgi:hypothetical protein
MHPFRSQILEVVAQKLFLVHFVKGDYVHTLPEWICVGFNERRFLNENGAMCIGSMKQTAGSRIERTGREGAIIHPRLVAPVQASDPDTDRFPLGLQYIWY